MKKMVAVIHPFDFIQKLYVFEDGNQTYMMETPLKNLNDSILTVAESNAIEQIDLTGSKQYNRGLAKQLREAETAKYNTNKLKINII